MPFIWILKKINLFIRYLLKFETLILNKIYLYDDLSRMISNTLSFFYTKWGKNNINVTWILRK